MLDRGSRLTILAVIGLLLLAGIVSYLYLAQ